MKFIKTIYVFLSFLMFIGVTYIVEVYKIPWLIPLFLVLWLISTITLIFIFGGKIFMAKKKEDKKKKESIKTGAKEDETKIFDKGREERDLPLFQMDDENVDANVQDDAEVFCVPVEKPDQGSEMGDKEHKGEKEQETSPGFRGMDRLIKEINELKKSIRKKEEELLSLLGVR